MQREAARAIDHGGREVFVTETRDPPRELPAEGGHSVQLSVAPWAFT